MLETSCEQIVSCQITFCVIKVRYVCLSCTEIVYSSEICEMLGSYFRVMTPVAQKFAPKLCIRAKEAPLNFLLFFMRMFFQQGFRLRPEAGRIVRSFLIPRPVLRYQYLGVLLLLSIFIQYFTF